MNAENLLKKCKPKIIRVENSRSEKDYYNNLNEMITYPQIFLIDEKDNYKIKIGGYDDVKRLLNKIFKKDTLDYSEDDCELLEKFFLNK
jgi:glutaredoxin